MDERRWYEAEALMANLTSHHHEIPGASEEEIERRMSDRYPSMVTVLVREKTRPRGPVWTPHEESKRRILGDG